jgi:hypothetical protein
MTPSRLLKNSLLHVIASIEKNVKGKKASLPG